MTTSQPSENVVVATLPTLLQASAQLHHHLCSRQVLGVRMGLLAGWVLGVELPQADKRLLTIVETDGCLTAGISVATNCWVNHRTMRIEDYGKVAATFVDTLDGRAVSITPRPTARSQASALVPQAANRLAAMLLGYQMLADDELLAVQAVTLPTPMDKLTSQAGRRAVCAICGEVILNQREVVRGREILCRACAGLAYYRMLIKPFDESVALAKTASIDVMSRLVNE